MADVYVRLPLEATGDGNVIGTGASGQVSYWNGTSTQTGSSAFTVAVANGASSGVQPLLTFAPAVTQSSTAGYTGLIINVTETSVGSGTKRLQEWQVGGSVKASIDNLGTITGTGLRSPNLLATVNDTTLQLQSSTRSFSAASGSQNPVSVASTISQSGTAGYTGLLVNMTESSVGSGFKYVQDWQVNSISVATIANSGIGTFTGLRSANLLTAAGDTSLQLQSARTFTNSSGIQTPVVISPNITQTSTAGYSALLINPTETSVGSGTKLLLECQVGGVSRHSIANTGAVTVSGLAASTYFMSRHTTGNTAGNNLTITSGGATSGATDKAAGDLVLNPGISTGTGLGSVKIQRLDRAATTGTADNAQYDAAIAAPPKALTNNSAIGVFEVALTAGSSCGGSMAYNIECTNGTDYQVRSGVVVWAAVNKGGVYTSNIGSTGEQSALSTGTLANTWTIVTGTNKITITLNANSSLTPTVLKVWGFINNNSGRAITLL